MEKEQSREILADCLHKLELIRNSFNYHKLPEMGKALGVYEGAAQADSGSNGVKLRTAADPPEREGLAMKDLGAINAAIGRNSGLLAAAARLHAGRGGLPQYRSAGGHAGGV
jgi:hypothetical protein